MILRWGHSATRRHDPIGPGLPDRFLKSKLFSGNQSGACTRSSSLVSGAIALDELALFRERAGDRDGAEALRRYGLAPDDTPEPSWS